MEPGLNSSDSLFKGVLIIFSVLASLFLFSPVIALTDFPWHKSIFLFLNSFVLQSVIVSIKSTMISLIIIIVLGIPTAYFMCRYSFFGKKFIEIVLELPLVLPPSVGGILLLITFGRNGFIGKYLYIFGIQIPFTFLAVVMSQLFVAMPIFIQAVTAGFEKVDRELEIAAASLGASPFQIFIKVTLPLTKNSIITGSILSWARSLSEFGATILFAGNLAGKTQTLPLAIYTAMEKDLNLSMSIAVCLIIISVSVLILLKRTSNIKDI